MAFNWKPNPYFATTAYVSVAGSDLNDGSAQKPYRSLQKCKDSGKTLIQISSGGFRENVTSLVASYFGDGRVIIDRTFATGTFGNGISLYNIKLINNSLGGFLNLFYSINKGSDIDGRLGYANNTFYNVLVNCGTESNKLSQGQPSGTGYAKNYTYKNCFIQFLGVADNLTKGMFNSVFDSCYIYIATVFSFASCYDFNLFNTCQYKFGNDSVYKTQAQIEATYGLLGIEAVRAYYNAKFATSQVFLNSKVADPLFNNPNIDDYTLKPLSPARHMAYDGSFIGAYDVAFSVKPYANDLSYPDGFYNASKGANILASASKLSLARNADGNSIGGGQITTKPQDFIAVYELRTVLANQQIADRNRECIDTNADIDMSAAINAGTAITVGESYVVEGGSVVYNGITYATRTKFIAVTGQTAFTSADGGYLYLIKETPNRSTCEMRFKQTIAGTVINPGTNLIANSWYKVVNNSVTWNGLTIPIGDSFQALAGLLSFTGGGCIEIFNDADLWYEVEIGDKPMCKKVGNVISGAIDIGTDGKPLTNGHKEFYTASNIARTSQIIQTRYIQYRVTFQNKMLK